MQNHKSTTVLLIIYTAIFIFLTSCGVNSPATSSNNLTNTSGNLNVNGYQAPIHQYNLTRNAIEVSLYYNNPTGLTQKQIDLLKLYQSDIEQGAHDEDYDSPYPPNPGNFPSTKRTESHFMSAQSGYKALSDPPLNPLDPPPQSALDWMYNGDIYMFKTAKADFDAYIKAHPVISTTTKDPELSKIMNKLGHVLHMFQDMTSPPHVRNDNHSGLPWIVNGQIVWAGHSKYEELGAGYYPDIAATAQQIAALNIDIKNDSDLQSRFKELGYFTSTHFFSDDTIPDPNYPPPIQRQFSLPDLQSLGDPSIKPIDPITGLIYLPDNTRPLLVAEEKRTFDTNGNLIVKYLYRLDDYRYIVSKYYSSELMPKAITYSAAVIKYFLSEEEKKQTKKLYVITAFGLSVIDMNTDALINIVPLGGNTLYGWYTMPIAGIAINRNTHRGYATNLQDNTISVIDTDSDTVINTIFLDSNISVLPTAVSVNPKTNKVYVVTRDVNIYKTNSHNISVIDAASNSVMKTITLPDPLYDEYAVNSTIDINQQTNTIYVTTSQSGKVYIIDGNTDTFVGAVAVVDTASGLGSLGAIKVNSLSNALYVSCGNNLAVIIGGGVMFVNAGVSTSWDSPMGITVNTKNNRLYISNSLGNVGVLDATNYALITTINLNTQLAGLIADTDTNKIYVAEPYDNRMVVIDGNTNQIIKTIRTDMSPNGGIGISAFQNTNTTNVKSGAKSLQNASTPLLPTGGIAIY